MNIKKNQLNSGLPEIRHKKDGSVNVVLAMWKSDIYGEDNLYIPAWTVSNTEYYHANANMFLGWIDLEDMGYDYE